MAEHLYLFCPKDAHYIRTGKSTKPVMEEVLVDPDAEVVEGEKPETKMIPMVRSYGSFLEEYIVSHPMFDVRRGHQAFAAGLRILDIAQGLTDEDKGTWIEFVADDAHKMKASLSAPKEDKKGEGKTPLSAADMREMTRYEQLQCRLFFDSIMNPRTSPPKVETLSEPKPDSETNSKSKALPAPVEATEDVKEAVAAN